MNSDSILRSATRGGEVEYEAQSLGTEFGAATDFKTKTVSFNRGDHLTTLALYYDDREGLKRRGINVEYIQAVGNKPNPFPADVGCEPPPGWTGSR